MYKRQEEGTPLKTPTLEFSYKNDDLGDPFINSYYALGLGLATQEEIDRILDKIRKSGYDSLTKEEKQTLFDSSNN